MRHIRALFTQSNSNNNNNVETLGPLNSSARLLVNDLGKKISCMSGEARATGFLFQRISVLVQRFNAVLLRDSLPAVDLSLIHI